MILKSCQDSNCCLLYGLRKYWFRRKCPSNALQHIYRLVGFSVGYYKYIYCKHFWCIILKGLKPLGDLFIYPVNHPEGIIACSSGPLIWVWLILCLLLLFVEQWEWSTPCISMTLHKCVKNTSQFMWQL